MVEHLLCWSTTSRPIADTLASRDCRTHRFCLVMALTTPTSLLRYPADSACHHPVLQEIHRQGWIILLAFVIICDIKNLK